MEDSQEDVKPWLLQGAAGIASLGLQGGSSGVSVGKVRLGNAYQRPMENASSKGVDLGVSVSIGSSTLTDSSMDTCGCDG